MGMQDTLAFQILFPPFPNTQSILSGMKTAGKSGQKRADAAKAAAPKSMRDAISSGVDAAVAKKPRTAASVSPTNALAHDHDDSELAQLLLAIAKADQAALATFYDATVSRVYSVALRIVRLADLAEEVTADVFMQVWREASRYDINRGRVLGWLLIIARSRALDLLRRRDEAFSHPDPHELVEEPEEQRSNPQDLLLASEESTALHTALSALAPLQRHLLSLAFFKGFTHSEIVAHTHLPLGSVKTHIRRALAQLRETLGANFADHL
jgi:RNA polymerase sigma factor (sigma-70 family)